GSSREGRPPRGSGGLPARRERAASCVRGCTWLRSRSGRPLSSGPKTLSAGSGRTRGGAGGRARGSRQEGRGGAFRGGPGGRPGLGQDHAVATDDTRGIGRGS